MYLKNFRRHSLFQLFIPYRPSVFLLRTPEEIFFLLWFPFAFSHIPRFPFCIITLNNEFLESILFPEVLC